MSYAYLLQKIKDAPFQDAPFKHIQINNFFNETDFQEITNSPQIKLQPQDTDKNLFDSLFQNDYKMIEFPGCITNMNAYIDWHKGKSKKQLYNNTSCEGFGVTLRLTRPKSDVISNLMAFMQSEEFQNILSEKFELQRSNIKYDAGIQKYLDGYEISPHPDIREKALTFMVNINPNPDSEFQEHHTHYLTFRNSHKYVQAYWEGNPEKDRCWVPWNWCESQKIQSENNSIVIFAPGNDTVHAVKANYDHLTYQRTQLYGNFWYKNKNTTSLPAWESFVFNEVDQKFSRTLKSRVASILTPNQRAALKKLLSKNENTFNHR